MVFFKWMQSFKGCHLTIQPAVEYADCSFSGWSTLMYLRVLFCISAGCASPLFGKFVAGFATQSPVKEAFWPRKVAFN